MRRKKYFVRSVSQPIARQVPNLRVELVLGAYISRTNPNLTNTYVGEPYDNHDNLIYAALIHPYVRKPRGRTFCIRSGVGVDGCRALQVSKTVSCDRRTCKSDGHPADASPDLDYPENVRSIFCTLGADADLACANPELVLRGRGA
jgi:hypothetical protein